MLFIVSQEAMHSIVIVERLIIDIVKLLQHKKSIFGLSIANFIKPYRDSVHF